MIKIHDRHVDEETRCLISNIIGAYVLELTCRLEELSSSGFNHFKTSFWWG